MTTGKCLDSFGLTWTHLHSFGVTPVREKATPGDRRGNMEKGNNAHFCCPGSDLAYKLRARTQDTKRFPGWAQPHHPMIACCHARCWKCELILTIVTSVSIQEPLSMGEPPTHAREKRPPMHSKTWFFLTSVGGLLHDNRRLFLAWVLVPHRLSCMGSGPYAVRFPKHTFISCMGAWTPCKAPRRWSTDVPMEPPHDILIGITLGRPRGIPTGVIMRHGTPSGVSAHWNDHRICLCAYKSSLVYTQEMICAHA